MTPARVRVRVRVRVCCGWQVVVHGRENRAFPLRKAPTGWSGPHPFTYLAKNVAHPGRNVRRHERFEDAVSEAEALPQVECGGITLESGGYTLRIGTDLRNAKLNSVQTELASWLRL